MGCRGKREEEGHCCGRKGVGTIFSKDVHSISSRELWQVVAVFYHEDSIVWYQQYMTTSA